MLVDATLVTSAMDRVPNAAREIESLGYDGAWTAETQHDPFFPALLAAEHTERVQIGTGIAVAFARNPMTTANLGWDIQTYSQGRFVLGLGSQIKPHIEKRFSMPWSHPAARMREFVLALRAIWQSWETGDKLDFRGDFYTHTLMTPFFSPGKNAYGPPPMFLAAVGEKMTEVAGEVADGIIVHGFTTERYLREVTLPALERGLERGGRTRADIQISAPLFVVTGLDEAALVKARQAAKQQIAFYASTPAYRPVLELHGWGDLQTELNALSKRGEWVEMGERVSDEVLDTFAIVGAPEHVTVELRRRYSDVVDRLSFTARFDADPDRWRAVVADLRGAN
jgi:probable F420-dependent oxidoreductase